ncbi:MAG: ATP-binding cassette domain-containing protein [Pseudomonadota bacterium]
MPDAVLTLENVVKRFGGFKAVDDVSFSVEQGEIFGFLGPNGAGKTTTLRMILDIIQPTDGTIEILGSPSAIPVRHRIGYLPEERGLYRKMRAAETIAYFARLRGVPGGEAKKRAFDLLERFGLKKFARSKNEALSKGMAQKVQLLATIAHDPEFLILDEPFSGLDPINQATLEELIADLKAEGRTIIFSTHVMEHAERLCDRFLILSNARKKFEGTLEEARASLPPRILIKTADPIDALRAAPGVIHISERKKRSGQGVEDSATAPSGAQKEFIIELAQGADPQRVLQTALANGVTLTKFEQGGASLHDIFVAIAGEDPETASLAPGEAA